jgi:hypothetical protein
MTSIDEKLGLLKNYYNWYSDEKDSDKSRYLIHVSKSASITYELKIYLTTGLNQWFFNLNEKSYQSTQTKQASTFAHFLDHFYEVLCKKQFSLHKIFDKETNRTLIKFYMTGVDMSYYFQPDDAYEPVGALTNLCFSLTDKCLKLESELLKAGYCEISNEPNSLQSRERIEPLKKAFLGEYTNLTHTQRKPGMSIINPHSKKRKIPKGVQFGDQSDSSSD